MSQSNHPDYLSKIPELAPHEHASVDDILQQQGQEFTLKGKTALITGASSGIGVETVRALAAAGAKVFVAVRDVEKTKEVLARIAAAHPNNGGLEIVKVDLDSLESVNAAADDFLSRSSQLNILINNAGVMNLPSYTTTKDGHEYQFGVNHLAHFLLFKRLLPLLLKSSTPEFQSRVVNVASSAHLRGEVDLDDLHFTKRGYNGWVSYGQSKTANILMAREIERRYGTQGVHGWALHPGGIKTDLQRHTPLSDFVAFGFFNEKGEFIGSTKFKSVTQGAATTVWAAVSKDLEGKGGHYLEDVKIAQPNQPPARTGYGAHAYNDDLGSKLWEYSEKTVKA